MIYAPVFLFKKCYMLVGNGYVLYLLKIDCLITLESDFLESLLI